MTIRVIDQVASEADIPFASDSDGDGLANTIDTDDDNDGVLDNNDAQPLNAASSSPLTTSVSVATSADAPLLGNSTSNANTNYGTAATAQTRNGFRGLLMKFSLPADGVLQSATLKLYTSTENDPLDVYLYADNSWTEGGVTFNNANWENSVFLGTTGSPSGGIYSYTLPQNAALAPGQTVSLYVEDPDDPSGNVEALFTKETAGKAPYLMIEKSEPSPLNISFSDQEVYRNGGSFTVNVSMRSAPSGVVYAPLAVSDPSIASIVGASVLTFTPDNWADPQTVEITPGGVGAFTLVARPLHSADANFNGINPEDVLGFKVTAIDLAAGTAVTATTGQILSQDLEPTSAVGAGSFRWQLLSGPKGLNVVENSGRLTFRPTSDQAGLNTTAILQATDQFGNTANFEIPITVSAGVNADPVGIYVVPGIGSDSTGNGTAANPYGSIAYALDRAAETNQSTVFIRGGEYSFGSNKQTISTAANSEIVVKPLPGEHVKLNFSGFTGFDITSTARNITFEGLEIDGGSDSADFWDIVSVGFWTPDQISRGGGIAFNVDGQFITLRDNYIHDAYQKAVEIKDGRYVEVDGNIIRNIATTSLSGGHGIMRQQKGAEFFDNDLPGELRWDITGNLIFNVEQRIYSWVPSKGFIEMVLDEGKPILIDDPKDTNGSQEQMAARISNNVVAYGAIDGIRLKSTPNLEVSNNSVFSQAPLADGVSDRDGDTSTPKFTNFEFTNNAVQVSTDRFAVEIDDAVADAGTGAVVSGNVVAGGQIKPSGQAGISNLGNVDLFTDALNGDFSINPTLNLSGVGVDPAILAELNARTEAFGVEIGWDRWEVDHLKLTQTILDNIPGVNDGVVGNEIAFTDQGTFNSARTTLSFTTVNGSWKTSRGAASTMDFHLNDDYSTWYKSIENNYKQVGGANYSRIRWGDSVFAQNQILASDGLLVSKVHGTGASTQISAAGRSITLGGDLLVDLYDYDPSKGRTFDLITASQLTSSFDRVLFKQPATAHSAVVNLVDTDADTFADTLRLTVGSDNLAPTGTVTISGTATEGQTLTAANSLADADGIPSSGSGAIAYQWNADGTPISGATGSTLVLTQAQVGKAITVTASYTDNGGTTESVTSAATAAVANLNDSPTGTVTISGTATEGQTLTAANTLADADGIPSSGSGAIAYQWNADGTPVSGATGSTLVLTQAQVGKAITVTASYTDNGGTTESVASAATAAVANLNDSPTGTVTISGTATEGQTLTAANSLADADGIPSSGSGAIAYQWNADGTPISGATGSTLVLTQAQVGKAITVTASYTDNGGTAESVTSAATAAVANLNDSPTGTVTISGTAAEGQTLTAANSLADADGIPSSGSGAIAYQWNADGTPISGATGSTLVLTQAQVGKAITVTASYTDNGGTAESVTSAATAAVSGLSSVQITSITDNVGLFQGVVADGGMTNDTTPTLTGTLTAALTSGATLRVFRNDVYVGNATVSGTTWSYTSAALAAGVHSFKAAIFSSAGVAGMFSTARSMVLDITVPTQTVTITGVNDDTDPIQGTVVAGGRTNDTTPTISGSVSAALGEGETLKLYNGTTFLADAVVDNTALTWSASPSISANATYTITARVVDQAGNQGPLSTSRSFILDTVAPGQSVTISGISDNLGTIQGAVADGGITNDTTPTISGSLSAVLGTSEVLTIYRNGVAAGNATVNSTNKTWTYTPATPLSANGTYTFTAAVVDGAGNSSPLSNSWSIVLDATVPTQTVTITGVNDDTDPIQGTVVAGGRTNDTTPTISGSVSAALGEGETLKLYNGTTFLADAVVDNTALTWSASPSISANATYTITARVVDQAGNQGPLSTSRSFILDTVAPGQSVTISGISDNLGTIQGAVADGGITNDTTPTISGSLSAVLGTSEVLTIYRNGIAAGNATVNSTNKTWTYTPATPLSANGTYTFTAAVVDGAGNSSPLSNSWSIVLDATVPTQTVTITGVSDNTDPNQATVVAAGRTNDTTPTITGSLSAALGEGETLKLYNGTTFLADAVVDNTALTWTATPTLSTDGSYAINARVVDAAGNQGPASTSRSLILDRVAPVQTVAITGLSDNLGTITGPIAEGGLTNDTTPTLSGTLSAALGSSEVLTIYRNGVAAGNATVNSTNLTWSYTPATPLDANGTYSFTAAVVDAAGNSGELSAAHSMVLDAPISTAQQDTLTGTSDGDVFLLPQLTWSLLGTTSTPNYDTITGFQSTDRIQLSGRTLNTRLTSSAGVAASLSEADVATRLTTTWAANSARAFTVTGYSGTFLALNDTQAGYQANSDAIVFLQGYSVSSTNSIGLV